MGAAGKTFSLDKSSAQELTRIERGIQVMGD